jgi:hypothetical protein
MVMNIFSPLMRQTVAVGTARVRRAAASDAGAARSGPRRPTHSPVAIFGR